MPRGGKRPGSGRKGNGEPAAAKKAAATKKADPLAALAARKRIYLESLVTGKTKRQSALDAGYSESVARTAKEHIETPDVREAFAELIRSVIPAEKIVARIAEGLDAMETKVFSFQGIIFDETELIAWTERREYAKMAAEYGRYFVPKQEISGPDGTPIQTQEVPCDLSALSDEQLEQLGHLVAALRGNPAGAAKTPKAAVRKKPS